MRKLVSIVLAAVVGLSASGCAPSVGAPVMMPPGLIITMTTLPLDTDMSDEAPAIRQGSATAVNILGLFAFGNAGIDAAARSAGIEQIAYADYRAFSIFLLFTSYTTVVYGS